MTEAQLATLDHLCREPGMPKWHYWKLHELPRYYYRTKQVGPAMFSTCAYPTRLGRDALAAAPRQGGDVQQAPGEAPQSGPNESEGNAHA